MGTQQVTVSPSPMRVFTWGVILTDCKQAEEAVVAFLVPSAGSAAPTKDGDVKQSRIFCLWV